MTARPGIGARGRRFTLEVPQESPDGFGGVIRIFQPGAQLWGSIELLSARERFRAGREEAAATHRLVLAFRAGITAAMQVTLGPRRFRITHVGDPDGRGRALVCLVEEVGP
jgi:SPP1 family predicted phage head-tail adaptor